MTKGHPPECRAHYVDGWIVGDCICDELRACEERMRREGIEITYVWDEDEIEAIRRINFSKGRNAAREAVAVIRGKWVFGPRIYKHEALTVIDALREPTP